MDILQLNFSDQNTIKLEKKTKIKKFFHLKLRKPSIKQLLGKRRNTNIYYRVFLRHGSENTTYESIKNI